MRHFLWVPFLLILASCSSTPEPLASAVSPAPAPSSPAAEPASDRVVELSRDALANIHIVIEAAQQRSVPRTLRVPGRVTVDENRVWRVGALTEGLVVDMSANIDDRVQQGQVLARLHSQAVPDGRAEYARAKSELATLETRHAFLKAQAARARRLLALKAASEQQVQEAESEARNVEGLIESARTEVERHRIHLAEFLQVSPDSSPASPSVAGYRAADLIPIKAPGSGIVMERPVAPGAVVQAGQAVCVISDLSSVWMLAEVQQQNLAGLREGMLVQVRSQAFPDETFPGRITRIASELNAATRTVVVRIEVPNRGLRLRPEMYADAGIEIGGSDEGLFIKQGAVQELHGQSVVFVKQSDTTFALHAVELGAAIGDYRHVLSGLRDGDQVVVDGSFLLKSKLLEASLAEE
jgi:cobalt-zinc-cadmium efflux system membrane fusion protein